MADSVEQLEFRKRVIEQYLPAWCASYPPPEGPYDPLNFVVHNDWSFPTPGIAQWFLTAVDEGIVETAERGFTLGGSWADGIFARLGSSKIPPEDRRLTLRRESIIEVGAVGMLALRYGWPAERLRFQVPRLDFGAYADDERSEVVIAGEAKQYQLEADELAEHVKVCGAIGAHDDAECWPLRDIPKDKNRNHHRKYEGLVELRPRIFWIVGPTAFTADDPDLVFAVEQDSGGVVHLHPTEASHLAMSRPSLETTEPALRSRQGRPARPTDPGRSGSGRASDVA
jgi:hypothetical protein